MQQKKAPKIFLSLEKKIEFECIQEGKGCFCKNGDGVYKPCVKSPCPLNLFNFGTHERILENFLDNEEWDEAYYYFQDLLPKFSIDCDVEELEKIKREKSVIETIDLPPGCRVFKISEELWEIKRNLKSFKGKDGLSERGQEGYNDEKNKFKNKLHGNFEILKHLALDKKIKMEDEEKEMKFKLLLVGTQMADLKPEAMELPLHKDVEDALKDKKKKEKKDNIAGF